MTLEDVVRHYEDFSYQLYFANDKSVVEIESNVRMLSPTRLIANLSLHFPVKRIFPLAVHPVRPSVRQGRNSAGLCT